VNGHAGRGAKFPGQEPFDAGATHGDADDLQTIKGQLRLELMCANLKASPTEIITKSSCKKFKAIMPS